MDKITLQAKNRQELEEMIKRTITLNSDEKYEVRVVKEPKKVLFFEIKGTYEVTILKKFEEQKQKTEVKSEKKEIVEKKTKEKNEFKRFENTRNNYTKFPKNEGRDQTKGREYPRNSIKETEPKEQINEDIKVQRQEQKQEIDSNINKIRSFMKEFIVNSKLDIVIVNIEKVKDRYIVNLDGKDMRYLIGEKGSSLNSVEYLLSSVKLLKNIKVVIDSNNYKQKREESLRNLARKKGKKVLENGKNIKLNPMSARERKIIHEEISFIKGLETESIGEEPKRYLVIKRTRES